MLVAVSDGEWRGSLAVANGISIGAGKEDTSGKFERASQAFLIAREVIVIRARRARNCRVAVLWMVATAVCRLYSKISRAMAVEKTARDIPL